MGGRSITEMPLWYAPDAGPTEGNGLWAARRVVSYRKRTSDAAYDLRCERDVDCATSARGEARTAGIGLGEVSGRSNASDVQRVYAVITQCDERRTGDANTLACELQGGW